MKDAVSCEPAAAVLEAGNIYLNGTVEGPYVFIKEGRLVVRHPPEGPYPVVVPCQGARLVVNGRECTEATPVTMQDTVLVEAVNERRAGEWSVTISADGLQAILRVSPTVVICRELADLPPAGRLQLAVVEREELLSPLTWDELLEELSRLGIVYGIDWEACRRGVASCAVEEVVVARGIPAEPGKDSWVELLFPADYKVPVRVEEEKTVDLRERYVFTSAQAGKILALKHPSQPGRPGTSVKGDIIIPPPVRDCTLIAGEGTVLARDGVQAVAARDGRPVSLTLHGSVRVSVLPELVHTGDVDLASGNISFKGDVVIAGNVEEGMKVDAGGNIRIGGLVSGAKIQAAGSVLIRGNILTSAVTAGGITAYAKEILPQVRTLANSLQKLITAVNQLLCHPSLKHGDLKSGLGPLLRLLLEGKFRHLHADTLAFKKQVEALPQGLACGDLDKFIDGLGRVVCSPLAVRELREVEKLARQALELEQSLASAPNTDSDVAAANILNSTVMASGDIRVVGGGCYNSRIQAYKKVIVAGVFRGGEIQAGGDVHIGELGSRSGSATRVKTGARATVTVNFAYENALVLVGAHVYRFNRKEKDVRLWLDQEGNLQSRAMPV